MEIKTHDEMMAFLRVKLKTDPETGFQVAKLAFKVEWYNLRRALLKKKLAKLNAKRNDVILDLEHRLLFVEK